jgi:hypothetical protein
MIRVFLMLSLASFFSIATQAQSAFNMNAGLNLLASGSPAVATWLATEHDFGTISQGTPVTHTFEVTNTGQQPLKLVNVKSSCGCTVAKYTKESIQPGEKGFVTATYNAKSVGIFAKSISVTTDIEEEPVIRLRLKGEVN